MGFRKLLIVVLLSCYVVSLNAYDSLVENEPYFKKAIEKSKLSGFGEDMVIAILDTGINDNAELGDKVIAEYDFTIDSKKVIDSNETVETRINDLHI